jgi:hypothetical protein
VSTALAGFSVTAGARGITRMGETPIVERDPSIRGVSLPSVSMASGIDLELRPEQPESVADAVAALIQPLEPAADAWWQSGIDEILER